MNDLSCKVLENLQQVFLFILAFYDSHFRLSALRVWNTLECL